MLDGMVEVEDLGHFHAVEVEFFAKPRHAIPDPVRAVSEKDYLARLFDAICAQIIEEQVNGDVRVSRYKVAQRLEFTVWLSLLIENVNDEALRLFPRRIKPSTMTGCSSACAIFDACPITPSVERDGDSA